MFKDSVDNALSGEFCDGFVSMHCLLFVNDLKDKNNVLYLNTKKHENESPNKIILYLNFVQWLQLMEELFKNTNLKVELLW